MANRIILNETSYFGWGSREVIIDEIKRRKFKHALVVTDNTLLSVGVADKVISILDENEIQYELFSDVKPNPTISNVKKSTINSLNSFFNDNMNKLKINEDYLNALNNSFVVSFMLWSGIDLNGFDLIVNARVRSLSSKSIMVAGWRKV